MHSYLFGLDVVFLILAIMKNNKILKNLINLNNLIYCVFQHRMFAENKKKQIASLSMKKLFTKINILSKQSICRSTCKILKCQPFDQIDLRLFSLFLSYDLTIFRFPFLSLCFFIIFFDIWLDQFSSTLQKHIENCTKLH